MIIGYNTNGFADHALEDSLTILSELGYESAAITLERTHLDPPDREGVGRCVELIRPLLERTGMRATIETGSRFILDPRRKHQPTLVSRVDAGRGRRIDFIRAAIEVATEIGAKVVSLWSGTADDETASEDELFDRLAAGLGKLLDHAAQSAVRLAFEPEPGMFIDTMDRFDRLVGMLDHPALGLTLDVGHVHCLCDGNLDTHLRRWRDRIWNVHLEDMKRGLHEHLTFGEGEIDFDGVFRLFREIAYEGPIHVELSRHSYDAVETARRAYEFLRRYT